MGIAAAYGIRTFIIRAQSIRFSTAIEQDLDHLNHDLNILKTISSSQSPSLTSKERLGNSPAKECKLKLSRYIDGTTSTNDFITELCAIRDNMTDLVYDVKPDALPTYLIQISNLKKELTKELKELPQKRLQGKLTWYLGLMGFLCCLVSAIVTILLIKTPLYSLSLGTISFILLVISFRLSERGDRMAYESENQKRLISLWLQNCDDFIDYGEQSQLKRSTL